MSYKRIGNVVYKPVDTGRTALEDQIQFQPSFEPAQSRPRFPESASNESLSPLISLLPRVAGPEPSITRVKPRQRSGVYNQASLPKWKSVIISSQPPLAFTTLLPTLSSKNTHTSLPMDSYFSFTSFASSSASSKPEEVVIIDQEGGSTGGQGYCVIA
ncbi:hypothetical protein M407DRAFT_26742 [Tulasnella calospora MUT 4182]|uniref:Uncharacterized protein n=1 Tax=Tulasnella calospora MUT 4182 TaxID=1051891 RepID=A0A0C3QF59_9AGAM|nr:hypothetical protein M407DRAFT_26742 [Tulasnella calospora MUT 4182]